MTIAIHRQQGFQRTMLALGLVAAVTVATVAVVQGRSQPASNSSATAQPAVTVSDHEPSRLAAIQDGYLPPRSTLAEQAKAEAFMNLQDGYLPPAAEVSSSAESRAFLAIQDGYLPPVTSQPSDDGTIDIDLGRRGPK